MKGLYPLHLAMLSWKSEDLVMKLIELFPEAVSQTTKYGTALNIACRRNRSDTVIAKLIKIYPLALQEKDTRGSYPIHSAFDKTLFPIDMDNKNTFIKILLDNDPLALQRRKEGGRSNDSKTPFHLACQMKYYELVKYIMQRSDLIINIRDKDGCTPLHYACSLRGGLGIIEMLLDHPDVDVNATDDNLIETPLHKVMTSLYGDYNESTVKVVEKLLHHPCILINEMNKDNKTPLDLMKDNLEKKRSNINDPALFQRKETILQYGTIICNILQEFPIKKRWNAYCYHVQNFVVDLDL